MKYKYIVGLLVALSLNNAFAAEEITAGDYQQIYLAFRCGGTIEINAALANNQTFNHKDDTDIIRSSQTGLALRKAVIGLSAADLQAVVETNHEFFKTSLGISLVYGWTLNQFKEPVTPYYIGYYFSFDKLFQDFAGKMDDNNVVTFLRSAFTRGLSAVDADRWAFYDHMLYLPYAIEQVRLTEARTARTSALSIHDFITIAHRTKEEAKSEKARVPGRAAHLDDLSAVAGINLETCGFVGLQKYTVANPDHCARIDSNLLATFQSLPADTKEDYVFMRKSLNDHMTYFRVANEVEADPSVIRVPVPLKCQYKGLESVVDVATNITEMKLFQVGTLSTQQFEKILRLAVTENINGIDEHTPGHETLLPYMNYKRDYLGTLDHTDVDLDKLVEEEDLAGYLDTIDASEHAPAKTELVGKSIKALAIELRDELLEADDEKKRAAVEEERKNAIVFAFQNLKLRLPKEKVDKLKFSAFTGLILEIREIATQMINERFIEGATASKLAEHIATLSSCRLNEKWEVADELPRLKGGFLGPSAKAIKERDELRATTEASNIIIRTKKAAAKALVIIMRDTNLTA